MVNQNIGERGRLKEIFLVINTLKQKNGRNFAESFFQIDFLDSKFTNAYSQLTDSILIDPIDN